MQTANSLIVVDYQNSFIPEDEWGTWELWVEWGGILSPYITQVMKEIKTKWWLIVATRDWHPQKHMSFASNHPGKQAFEELDGQILWPDHCIAGTPGAEYFSEIPQELIDHHIIKWYDADQEMYSWFSGKEDTPKWKKLVDILKKAWVNSLKLVGLATDYCVHATALDALKNWFRVEILSRWIAWVDPAESIKILKKLRKAWVEVSE